MAIFAGSNKAVEWPKAKEVNHGETSRRRTSILRSDVISLIRATGALVDPRSSVIHQARRLISLYREFAGSANAALERITILASMAGLEVAPMDVRSRTPGRMAAVLIPTGNLRGKKGQILYDPRAPSGRIVFSVAHEVAHTFFPTTSPGARFRGLCASDSMEANELERLCDLAASELVMPLEEFRVEARNDFHLQAVPRLSEIFGTSYEATVFRLATANPGIACAGLLRYRRKKDEQRLQDAQANQLSLLNGGCSVREVPEPKYRRQSFHPSAECGEEYVIRWNKSFDTTSCVYAAARTDMICSSVEALPSSSRAPGLLEAVRAPFQREEAPAENPDILFFWSKL
jgi:hypothetical protein